MKVTRTFDVEEGVHAPGKCWLHVRGPGGMVSQVFQGATPEECRQRMQAAGWQTVPEK